MPSSAFSFLDTINIQQTIQLAMTMVVAVELCQHATALFAKMYDIPADRHYFARDLCFMAVMLGCMDLMRRVWLCSIVAFNESNTKSTITNLTSIYALEPKQEAKKVGAPGSEGQCVGTKEETKETKAAEQQEIKPEATTDGAATPPPNKKSITPPPAMESNGPKEE